MNKTPPNKDRTSYQYLKLQSFQTQMPRHHGKNMINNSQTMPPLDPSNPTIICPEKCNIVEAQVKKILK